MSYVWVAQESADEHQNVYCVATSLDQAVVHIESMYGDPYKVEWSLSRRSDASEDRAWLTGHFEAVPGYCMKGTNRWNIWRMPLVGE